MLQEQHEWNIDVVQIAVLRVVSGMAVAFSH
jgi:hypothetical protein